MMIKEQIEKHGEVMKWFIDNPDKGVWWKHFKGQKEWYLVTDPSFDEYGIYVKNDEYAEFRKALADGKQLQIRDYMGKWMAHNKTPNDDFTYPVNQYRIKPEEPGFKVGDWVTIKGSNPKQFKRFTGNLPQWNKSLDYENVELLNGERFRIPNFDRSVVKRWKPKAGELCVFWDNNDILVKDDFWVIGKLDSICKEKYYQDKNGNKWDNIAPLEFIDILKENR